MTDAHFSIDEFENFYTAVLPGLRRISRETQGEYTVDDLKNEAWVLVFELQEKGITDNLSSPRFQNNILARLCNRFCKFTSKVVRFAVRIDDKDDDADDGKKNYWLDGLTASHEDDPLLKLCKVEEMQEKEKHLQSSYSEAMAYVNLLENFHTDRKAISEHLSLSWKWILQKMRRARCWVKKQCSLFDGVEIIDDQFMPPPNKLQKQKPFTRAEYAFIEQEQRRLQKRLFPRAYIPIRVIEG